MNRLVQIRKEYEQKEMNLQRQIKEKKINNVICGNLRDFIY
jgi:hypothetical protein